MRRTNACSVTYALCAGQVLPLAFCPPTRRLACDNCIVFSTMTSWHRVNVSRHCCYGFETRLRGVLSFEELKKLLDLRIVVCDALVAELIAAIGGSTSRVASLDLVVSAAEADARLKDLVQIVANCRSDMEQFSLALRETVSEIVLQGIGLVDFWLTDDAPSW